MSNLSPDIASGLQPNRFIHTRLSPGREAGKLAGVFHFDEKTSQEGNSPIIRWRLNDERVSIGRTVHDTQA